MNGELLRGDFTYVFVFVLSAQLHCYIHKLDSWRRLFWNEAIAHCRWKANKLRWGTYINDVLFFFWRGRGEFWPPTNPDQFCPISVYAPILKFIYSEKATKFCEISTLDLSYVVTVKSTVEISQNFVAFSECMNFKPAKTFLNL